MEPEVIALAQLGVMSGVFVTLLGLAWKVGRWMESVDGSIKAINTWQQHHEDSHHAIPGSG